MERAPIARRSFAMLLWLFALEAAGAEGFGAVVGASSDSVFRGVSESSGDPALQADLHYAWAGGAFAGLRAASTKPYTPSGPRHEIELNPYVGFAFAPATAWSGRVMLVHYDRPWAQPERPAYDELAIGATWLGRLSLSAAASPNKSIAGRTDAAYAYEAAVRWPAAGRLSLDAGIGYYDLSRLIGTGYAYWSAGALYSAHPLTIGVSWIGTDDNARESYGDTAGDRVVASALWAF